MKKNTVKKLLSLALAAVLALSLFACGKKADSDTKTDSNSAGTTTYKVGICNYVDDASLNQIVSNIESRLKAIGQEKGVTFDVTYDNCNADSAVLNQIIANFMADKVDLMIGVATPVAVAMQTATEGTDIPVVFAAVSDPVSAGLVESLEAPGANITGTSDALDTSNVFNLIEALNPDVTKIGLLYDASQDSSTKAIEEAEGRLNELGIEYEAKTGTTTDDLALAAQALCDDGVQVVFTPTDNTVQVAEPSIYTIFEEAGVQHFGGADSFALVGAFCGYGVDYANLGTETAKMAVNILENAQNPAEVPVQFFDNGKASSNTDVCAALGLDYDEVSKTLAPLCTEVEGLATGAEF